MSVVWVVKVEDIPEDLEESETWITGTWEPFAITRSRVWYRRQIQSEHDEPQSSARVSEEDLGEQFAQQDIPE